MLKLQNSAQIFVEQIVEHSTNTQDKDNYFPE
jgi:hypothetical protein